MSLAAAAGDRRWNGSRSLFLLSYWRSSRSRGIVIVTEKYGRPRVTLLHVSGRFSFEIVLSHPFTNCFDTKLRSRVLRRSSEFGICEHETQVWREQTAPLLSGPTSPALTLLFVNKYELINEWAFRNFAFETTAIHAVFAGVALWRCCEALTRKFYVNEKDRCPNSVDCLWPIAGTTNAHGSPWSCVKSYKVFICVLFLKQCPARRPRG